MPTPPKTVEILRMEGKSHRTKAELERRERAEKAQLTGKKMREAEDVKRDPDANEVWKRVTGLLGLIGRNDALYEQQINRYCRLASEVKRGQAEVARLRTLCEELEQWEREGEIDEKDAARRMENLLEMETAQQSLLMRKRKMMMDIEKENLMTIAASLRSIPKSANEAAPEDPMAEMLRRRWGQ